MRGGTHAEKNMTGACVSKNVALLCGAVALGAAASLDMDAAFAQDMRRIIVVNGEGEVAAAPDQARLTAGVVTQEQTAAAALDANTRAMNAVFAAMKRLGIPDNRIRTANFTLIPQYPPRPDGSQARTIFAYQVSNQVTVILDDIAKVGATLDALVRSGANQSYGVVFEIANDKPLADKARRDAVADAAGKARAIAEAAGVSLGPVLSIQENGGRRFEPVAQRAFALAAEGPPPIAGGEQTIGITVTATFGIQ